MFLSIIRQNSTKTNSYSNNLIGPLILVFISFDISLINFTIISLKALSHGAIFLATCNAILLLVDVKLANTRLLIKL